MKTTVYVRLSAMMFFEYFIWGVWYVTMGTYLTKIGFQGSDVGSAYSTIAWAAVISAFFVSLIADKYFAAEKITGVLHILGGALMYYVSTITSPGLFFWVLLAYALCYMPTIALTTAIGLHHCTDPGKQYPGIRVLGTLGWIAAGLTISLLGVEGGPEPMWLAALSSVFLGLYSFTLPATPPKSQGKTLTIREVLGGDALKLMKSRSFAILSISALLITLPFAMYHPVTNMFLNEIGVSNAAGKMTLAQASEVIFMLMIPFLFVRLGIKKLLLIGMFAWAVRFVLFMYGNNDTLIAFLYTGILLHGVCYDFFYVTAQIYMDKKAPQDLRASVQGFFTLLTYGVGWLIGSYLTGLVLQVYQITDSSGLVIGHHWKSVMIVPAAISFVVAVLFSVIFKDDTKNIVTTGKGVAEPSIR
ncbi:MAG: nucleoside permease [Cyclobacteriaceae bacterium]